MTDAAADQKEALSGGIGAPAQPSPYGIFGNPQFSKLFFGSLLGNLADRIYQTALIAAAYVMFSDRASEDYKGTLQIVATVPLLILYPLSSSLVDAVNRRRLLVLVKGIKIFAVLAFVPLLWHVAELSASVAAKTPNDALRQQLIALWPWCLAVVVLMNIITVPFGPARAAAVPDVTDENERALGASLLATSGLVALLLGTFIGSRLATDLLGPALTIFVASALYFCASLLFSKLPDAVAVPGKLREKRAGDAPAAATKPSFTEYVADLWKGVSFCFTRGSVLALILFETAFWTLGSAFYLLLDFHGRTAFGLTGDALTKFSGNTFSTMGIGLLLGALLVGRICRKASPILTYTPAFTLIGVGLYLAFRSSAGPDGGPPTWLYPVLFGLGFGGGATLGRVDADVLVVTEASMRGRVFAIKGMFFAATILLTVVYLSEGGLTDDDKKAIARWLPRAFLMLIPVSLVLSWIVDVAIWAPKGDSELPGGLHQRSYDLIRFTARVLARLMFRYEVIGAEKIPKDGPCVLAANHASFIDPILLASCTDRMVQYIMYSSYYRSLAHPVFRFMRCIPVDEKNQLAALKAGAKSLSEGACVGIFPEGRVSADGNLQPPQGGALFLAQRAGAPVVPVAIKGNHAALPRGAWFPRFRKITLIVCDPFLVGKDLSRKETAELADKLMETLAQTLELPPPEKTADKMRDR